MKLIARAGYEPWPRRLRNTRASCATDWTEALPAQMVAQWLGHSPMVAAKHHLQTRNAHSEVATRGGARARAGITIEASKSQDSCVHANETAKGKRLKMRLGW
jgi:hypothetical protein